MSELEWEFAGFSVADLRTENASLRERLVVAEKELAEARKDAERLNWLEATRAEAEVDLGMECGWYVDESGAPIMRGELEKWWSKTLRAAIDAAIAERAQETP